MPEVSPFRGWRYDLSVAGALDHLICPPYDVITPAQAQHLLERYPRNVIHLELGAGEIDPTAHGNRYRQAAATLERWSADGALRHDARPCLYVYEQRFEHKGATRRRLAFLAAVRLSPWQAGDVLPHEVTHAAPKADRLALLRATRANISPIYALCDAGLPGVETLLAIAHGRDPDEEACDEAGEQHRLWAVDDEALIQGVCDDLAARPLYIADGHHRYETALAYAQSQAHGAGPEGAGYVMMAITPVDDAGLVVLPTHRLVRDLPPAQLARGLACLHESFTIQHLDGASPEQLTAALGGAKHEQAIVLYTRNQAMLLRPCRGLDAAPEPVPALGALDVTLVQQLLFEQAFGLTPDDLEQQRHVDYTRDAAEALRLVESGAYQLAVLLNGTPPQAILDVARAGVCMPQKSTYFYPKLATGLVLRRLEL